MIKMGGRYFTNLSRCKMGLPKKNIISIIHLEYNTIEFEKLSQNEFEILLRRERLFPCANLIISYIQAIKEADDSHSRSDSNRIWGNDCDYDL